MTLQIFLAEDSEFMLRHICDALHEHEGLEVTAVMGTERGAKDWLDQHPDAWDLAVVDLFLADGTGAGIIRHCRMSGVRKPIVVYTNHAVTGVVEHVRRLGADQIFDKSAGINVLTKYCSRLLMEKNAMELS